MARQPKRRQCPRCGFYFPGQHKDCPQDGAPMVARRWRMTPGRIKLVKTIAFRQKGLTEEEYRVRLKAITTRDSCKQLKRAEFLRFVNDLQRLPDAPTARVRAQHRRAA